MLYVKDFFLNSNKQGGTFIRDLRGKQITHILQIAERISHCNKTTNDE